MTKSQLNYLIHSKAFTNYIIHISDIINLTKHYNYDAGDFKRSRLHSLITRQEFACNRVYRCDLSHEFDTDKNGEPICHIYLYGFKICTVNASFADLSFPSVNELASKDINFKNLLQAIYASPKQEESIC